MATPTKERSPQLVDKRIWVPHKAEFTRGMHQAGYPQYQIDVVQMIKDAGTDALGVAYALAEPNQYHYQAVDVTMDQVLGTFPLLYAALSQGTLSERAIATGLERLHILDDRKGLTDITCLLPATATLPYSNGPQPCRVDIPPALRMPVDTMAISPVDVQEDIAAATIRDWSPVWATMQSYLGLPRTRRAVESYDEFMLAAAGQEQPMVPFGFAQQFAGFTVLQPQVRAGDGGLMSGRIYVDAVAMLEGSDGRHPPRTILAYGIYKIWSAASTGTYKDMTRRAALQIARGADAEELSTRYAFAGKAAAGR